MAKEEKARFVTIHPRIKKSFSKELMKWGEDPLLRLTDRKNFLDLLKVKVNYRIIEAALGFWDKNKEEFSFGGNKLCPTLEEIAAITDLPLNIDISVPVRASSYGNAWAKLFGTANKDLCQSQKQTIPYSAIYSKAEALRDLHYGKRWQTWKRMFELCFYGEVLFGRTNNKLDLAL
ncbi:hypothetical protein L8N14_014795, partial [Serratia marcescens]|nr:hypothetical protein [Serratia marcescens]